MSVGKALMSIGDGWNRRRDAKFESELRKKESEDEFDVWTQKEQIRANNQMQHAMELERFRQQIEDERADAKMRDPAYQQQLAEEQEMREAELAYKRAQTEKSTAQAERYRRPPVVGATSQERTDDSILGRLNDSLRPRSGIGLFIEGLRGN